MISRDDASAEDATGRVPDWVDDELIAETKTVWEPYYGRPLTIGEAIEILQGFGRLVDHLAE